MEDVKATWDAQGSGKWDGGVVDMQVNVTN